MDCPLFDRVETVTARNVFAIFRCTACQRFPTLFLSPFPSPSPSRPLSFSPFPLLLFYFCRWLVMFRATPPLLSSRLPHHSREKQQKPPPPLPRVCTTTSDKRERPTPGQGRRCAALRRCCEIAPILAAPRPVVPGRREVPREFTYGAVAAASASTASTPGSPDTKTCEFYRRSTVPPFSPSSPFKQRNSRHSPSSGSYFNSGDPGHSQGRSDRREIGNC